MRRLKKTILLPVRGVARRWNRLGLYYWAEAELYELRTVNVMPVFYYRWLYRVSLRLTGFVKLRRLADRAIHTIPFHIRFDVA